MNALMSAHLNTVSVAYKIHACNFFSYKADKKSQNLQEKNCSLCIVHKLHRKMLHSTLRCFHGPLLVSTLVLWNFESFCISLPFLGWGVRGIRCYKKKQHKHLFLVVLPWALAASPTISYLLLCSSLLKCFLPLLYKLPHWFSFKGFYWSAVDF